jgi:hypothetical protein
MDEVNVIAAVSTTDQSRLDPLLDQATLAELRALQDNLAFLDARLRRAIQRKNGVAQGNG